MDYTYVPEETEQITDVNAKFSTSISELDNIQQPQEYDQQDIASRISDYTNEVPSNTMYPDATKPLFIATLPDTSDNHKGNTNTRLDNMTNIANKKKQDYIISKELQNISVKDFFGKIASSYLEIIDDLLVGNLSLDTFTKDYRLLAIGILFIILSIFFIFFQKI
jgi:hypothetical protein